MIQNNLNKKKLKEGKKMLEFKQDDFYIVRADKEKRQMYVEYQGYWEKESDVPTFKEECIKATEYLKNDKGFNVFIILNDKKPPKLAVQKMHRTIHKIWMAGGLRKGALIFKTGKMLQNFVISVLTKLSGAAQNVEIKTFDTEAEAQAWFDEDK